MDGADINITCGFESKIASYIDVPIVIVFIISILQIFSWE